MNIVVTIAVVSDEYCDYEAFEASCRNDETIIIGAAEYGHISVGKCVRKNLGQFGCKTDVSEMLNQRCSGKRSCSISVDDETLRNTEPCTVGILVYLKATYMCINGKSSYSCKVPYLYNTYAIHI